MKKSTANLIAVILVVLMCFVAIAGISKMLGVNLKDVIDDVITETPITNETPTTTKPSTTTKPPTTNETPTTTKPPVTPETPTNPNPSECEHDNLSDEYRTVYVGNEKHVTEWRCSDCGEFRPGNLALAMSCHYLKNSCDCLSCGNVNHIYEDGVCTRCGSDFPHTCNSSGVTVISNPTCTTTGEREFYCTVCKTKQYEETISALGHKVVDYHCTECDYITPHTCNIDIKTYVNEEGRTHSIKRSCSICGKEDGITQFGEPCEYSAGECTCTLCGATVHTYNGEIHCTVCGQ